MQDSERLLLVVETEEATGVVVADVLHHFSNERKIVGKPSALDVVAEDIAKQAAEVFVARVGEKLTAVGEHADELAKQAGLREALNLARHAVELIKEPPSAAELDFAPRDTIIPTNKFYNVTPKHFI